MINQVEQNPWSFAAEGNKDPLSEVFSYLSIRDLGKAARVSKLCGECIKKSGDNNLLLLRDINMLTNKTVRRYQRGMKLSGVALSFNEAATKCLNDMHLWQKDSESPTLLSVDLSRCRLTKELVDAIRSHGDHLRHLRFNNVTVHDGSFTHVVSGMTKLESLSISGQKVTETPDISTLLGLKKLQFLNCPFLEQLPTPPPGNVLQELEVDECGITTPPNLTDAPQLTVMKIQNCRRLTVAPNIPPESPLQVFDLSGCWQIQHVPDITHARALHSIYLDECKLLTAAPQFPPRNQIKLLNMAHCHGLTHLPVFTNTEWLETLILQDCCNLQAPPVMPLQSRLKVWDMSWCRNLNAVPDIVPTEHLETLDLRKCITLRPDDQVVIPERRSVRVLR